MINELETIIEKMNMQRETNEDTKSKRSGKKEIKITKRKWKHSNLSKYPAKNNPMKVMEKEQRSEKRKLKLHRENKSIPT